MMILATLAMATVIGAGDGSLADTVARISSGGHSSVTYGIDPGIEPLQKNTGPFRTSIPVSDGTATLTSDSAYTINARVESVKAYNDLIGDLVPYDLLLAWGDMADDDVGNKLFWEQGDRKGQVSGSLGGPGGVDLSHDYVVRHISNNHIIASTDRIERALTSIKPGDMVRIDGRLVDVRMSLNDGRIVTVDSSKSRTDQGEGACEIIYVEHLRVNGQLF